MRVILALTTIIFLSGLVKAQKNNPDLKAMVDAERAFIQMAKDQNRRDAFLYYLSDSAITAGPNGPQKGKGSLENQSVNDAWLYWEVGYSDIAASGDFGFNTGPWEYRTHKSDARPVAYGEFNSIWKKQSDGVWKNILDIGIIHREPLRGKVKWSTSARPLKAAKKTPPQTEGLQELLMVEKTFIA